MAQQIPDQNTIAYMLANELQKATEKFKKTHPALNINGIMRAENVFLATWLSHAPTKQEALEALEENTGIIRHLINETPDAFFTRQNPNLN